MNSPRQALIERLSSPSFSQTPLLRSSPLRAAGFRFQDAERRGHMASATDAHVLSLTATTPPLENTKRMRLITHENAKSKSEKFPPPHQDGSLGFQVGSSRRLDPSEIPFSSNSFTASYSKEPLQTWSGPLAPVGGSDSAAQRRKDANKERRMAAKLKGKRVVA